MRRGAPPESPQIERVHSWRVEQVLRAVEAFLPNDSLASWRKVDRGEVVHRDRRTRREQDGCSETPRCKKQALQVHPPAIAPTTRNGSVPSTTACGSGASAR